jgi:integrase
MSTPKRSELTRAKGIRERSPGHYELRAYNRATGKQVVRTFVAPRPDVGIRAAKAELAKLQTEIREGKHGGSNATLGFLLDEWLRHSESLGRSPNTLHGYRAKVKRIKASNIANKSVAKLTAHDIDVFYMQLRTEGMSPATLMAHHRVLRAALNQAERWQWVSSNVARQATLATAPRPELHVPTIAQAQELISRAGKTISPELPAIIMFAVLTGARRGELCGVQWGDVDWAGRRLTFRRSVWQVRSSWGLKDPKTHQVRTIALDDDTGMALLTARRARAEADARAAGVALADDAYVWSTLPDGHAPRTPNSLTRAFARLCRTLEMEAKAAGRKERWQFRFHDLRHLSATEMVGAGMDVRTVASRLGHADPSVTLRVYAHALEERDREAAEGLGRSLALPRAD